MHYIWHSLTRKIWRSPDENFLFKQWKWKQLEEVKNKESQKFAWKFEVQSLWHAFGRTFAISYKQINNGGYIRIPNNLTIARKSFKMIFCWPFPKLCMIYGCYRYFLDFFNNIFIRFPNNFNLILLTFKLFALNLSFKVLIQTYMYVRYSSLFLAYQKI